MHLWEYGSVLKAGLAVPLGIQPALRLAIVSALGSAEGEGEGLGLEGLGLGLGLGLELGLGLGSGFRVG